MEEVEENLYLRKGRSWICYYQNREGPNGQIKYLPGLLSFLELWLLSYIDNIVPEWLETEEEELFASQ